MIVSSRSTCLPLIGTGMVRRILMDDPRQTSFDRERHLLNMRSNLNVSLTGNESSIIETDFTARAKNAGDLYSSMLRNPDIRLLDSRTISSYRSGSIQALTSFETKQYVNAVPSPRRELMPSIDTEWRTVISRTNRTISRGRLEKIVDIGVQMLALVFPSCAVSVEDAATEVLVMVMVVVVYGQL